ncbi:MAG: hypothetical protein WCX64_04215 [Candidatus Micrarchaeia archaeon]
MARQNIAIIPLLALLLSTGFANAAYLHMVSYRTDPTPSPMQDFTLFVTFKNDYENSVNNANITLECPAEMTCPNLTATFPSYGIQELAFPIRSRAGTGLYNIQVSWDDSSVRYGYTAPSGTVNATPQVFSASIPLNIKEHSLYGVTASTLLYANENDTFDVSFDGRGLHNVQASLHSSCISFSTPLMHYDSLDATATIRTPALVNCRSGNADVIFTLQSDEATYAVTLNVKVDKRPHANVSFAVKNVTHYVGKDYYRVIVKNSGATAEDLYVSIVSNPAIKSSDVAYLGDFSGEREVVFELQSDYEGTYPLSLEAKWGEGKETFSTIQTDYVKLENRLFLWLLLAVLIVAAAAVYFIKK